ncbi:MAG TPA: hypothetical protein VM618_04615, partial [Acidimicrobiia bacterium]|nr:hypothetical protein [Acidimicrobiia bacterium]
MKRRALMLLIGMGAAGLGLVASPFANAQEGHLCVEVSGQEPVCLDPSGEPAPPPEVPDPLCVAVSGGGELSGGSGGVD